MLRSARAVRSLSQQDLGDASDRKYLWLLENGKSSPTLKKFDEIAQSLQFDPLTLLAMCIALRDGISVSDALERSKKEAEAFDALGGSELLSNHFAVDGFNSRASERSRKLVAVQECKRQGLTQKATIEKLGIPRSTVNDLWNLKDPETDAS